MGHKKCSTINPYLLAYLDGEIPPSWRGSVQEHLSGCDVCRQELATLSALRIRLSRSLSEMASLADPAPQAWDQLRLKQTYNPPVLSKWRSIMYPFFGHMYPFFGHMYPFFGHRRGEWGMKKVLLFAAVFLFLLAGIAMVFIPAVRAQVSDWISGQTAAFYFQRPREKVMVGLISDAPWGFVPLSPTYLPRGHWEMVPDAYTDEVTGIATLKLTLNKGRQFMILIQRKTLPGELLPEGEETSVNNQPAVFVVGISGEVKAGIPLDKDGGVLPGPDGQIRLYPIQYTDGIRLTWHSGGIRLEILSNLPLRQVLKIARSLQPVAVEPP